MVYVATGRTFEHREMFKMWGWRFDGELKRWWIPDDKVQQRGHLDSVSAIERLDGVVIHEMENKDDSISDDQDEDMFV